VFGRQGKVSHRGLKRRGKRGRQRKGNGVARTIVFPTPAEGSRFGNEEKKAGEGFAQRAEEAGEEGKAEKRQRGCADKRVPKCNLGTRGTEESGFWA
jgi:hypothetical protein